MYTRKSKKYIRARALLCKTFALLVMLCITSRASGVHALLQKAKANANFSFAKASKA